MNIQELWKKAIKTTEIIRPRVKPLFSDKATEVNYIFLAESKINAGDTVVRKGEVTVQKPELIMPHQLPIFENFDFDKNMGISDDTVVNFFLVRGVTFPTFKYKSNVSTLDIFEGGLDNARAKYGQELQRKEDVHTGLVIGDEECWQFCILILLADIISKGTSSDIKKLLDDFKR